MRRLTIAVMIGVALLVGCTAHHNPTSATLADLRNVRPDVQEVKV